MITIALTPSDRGGTWFASLEGADMAGGWHRSPEAAVVALMDRGRDVYADLANRSTRRHESLTAEEQALLLWLAGLFG